MRFYWGLGVGHVYSHKDAITGRPSEDEIMESEEEEDTSGTLEGLGQREGSEERDIVEDEDSEGQEESTNLTAEECLGLDDRDDKGWGDSQYDSTEGSESSSDDGGSGYGGMDSTN